MILAEYIWIDGTLPTPLIRSKTKVLKKGDTPPLWGFDGSSTNQATGINSDCVLKPSAVTSDPLRGGENILVFCEVYNTNMTPHKTNTRAKCKLADKLYEEKELWYGFEQEYTLLKQDGTPLGFPSSGTANPQGDYYCGAGTGRSFGREIAETHLYHCLQA